jgi:hypothetical protein
MVKEYNRMKVQEELEAAANRRVLADKVAQLSNIKDEAEDSAKVDMLAFTYAQRRQHFKTKLKSLEKSVLDFENERVNIDKNRMKLTFDMKEKEKRMLELKLEIERLKNFNGDLISSSVLHGSTMQYTIDDYRIKVAKSFERCQQQIANMKISVVKGEERKQLIKICIQKADTEQKYRQAAFLDFEQNRKRSLQILRQFNFNTNHDVFEELDFESKKKFKKMYFDNLKQNWKMRLEERSRVTNLFLNLIQRFKKSAFHRWKTGNFITTNLIGEVFNEKRELNLISVGDVLLKQSGEMRVELQALLRDVISSTADMKQKLYLSSIPRDTKKMLTSNSQFKSMYEGIDYQNLVVSRGMKYLLEGDGYAQEKKFELAKKMYEAQIILLRSCSKSNIKKTTKKNVVMRSSDIDIDVKMLAICHGRLGKMFLTLGEKNRAIVEFDRQLSLAREIEDKAEESEGFF